MKKNLETNLPKTRNNFPVEPTENSVGKILNYIKIEKNYIVKTRKVLRDKLYQPMTI